MRHTSGRDPGPRGNHDFTGSHETPRNQPGIPTTSGDTTISKCCSYGLDCAAMVTNGSTRVSGISGTRL
eukprot:2838803-Rhodomonas_salina.1